MKMDGEIRVKVSSRFNNVYNDMSGLVINEFHELFYLCVCIGYKVKQKLKLVSPEDKFWSRTFNPDEYSTFYAIMLKDNELDFSSIHNDKDVIKNMEEYANGGMDYLLKNIIPEYVIDNNGGVAIDKSISKELVKDLLYYLYEQSEGIEKK